MHTKTADITLQWTDRHCWKIALLSLVKLGGLLAMVCTLPTMSHYVDVETRVVLFCLFELHVLATSKVIYGRVPTCGSTNSWRHFSAAPLGWETRLLAQLPDFHLSQITMTLS